MADGYMEPALFGYAAAKVIESFINYYVHIREDCCPVPWMDDGVGSVP